MWCMVQDQYGVQKDQNCIYCHSILLCLWSAALRPVWRHLNNKIKLSMRSAVQHTPFTSGHMKKAEPLQLRIMQIDSVDRSQSILLCACSLWPGQFYCFLKSSSCGYSHPCYMQLGRFSGGGGSSGGMQGSQNSRALVASSHGPSPLRDHRPGGR